MADNDQTTATDVNVSDDIFDLGQAMVEETATSEESSPEETKEESTEPTEETKEETKPEDGEAQADDKEEETTEETESTDKQDAATKRKEQLNKEIRELVSQRREAEAQLNQVIQQAYKTESVEELVANGMEPNEARAEAAEQQLQMAQYSQQVTQLNSTVDTQTAEVLAEYSWADPQSPDYDEGAATQAYNAFMKAANPQIDQRTGLITQINVLPLDFYSAIDGIRSSASQRASAQGKVEGQKAVERMMATAEPASSTPAPSDSEENDPMIAAFMKTM